MLYLRLQFQGECGIGLAMLNEKKTVLFIIFFIFIFSLGFSLFVNLPALQKNFLFSDEAVYFSMTQSLAHDGDIEYTRRDLIRYYRSFGAGPLGIFLKKGKAGKIFFAKSWVYSLFAAPFVRLFRTNGFFVFHSILLCLILLMGWSYFSLLNRPWLSFLAIGTFLFASISAVYFLWMTPDFFNLSLVFSVLFLWLYKHAYQRSSPQEQAKGRLQAILLSDWSDYLACVIAAIAVFSKPPNIALMGPLVLHTLIKKRFVKAVMMILAFLAVSVMFWGANQAITGNWNYQGGERKTFYGEGGYPLEKDTLTFNTARGSLMTSEGYAQRHLFPPRVFVHNFFYYFFGRFSGITWYFFPAFLALFLFFIRRKQAFQWLILLALMGEILIYIILMPDNYAGGGGALANRYFLSIYPFFFFLPGLKVRARELGACWVAASLLIAPILINPLLHSHYPATHAKKFPFKLMPVELTLVNNFPTNTNPAAHRRPVGTRHSWLYFLDDNFIPRTSSALERNGFWTRGPKKAEMVLKTFYPIKQVTFRILNNPRKTNDVTVWFAGERKTITLGSKEWGTATFTPKKVFQMNQWIHMYKTAVRAAKGSIPHFEEETSDERRYLGVYFELDIVPEYLPD